MKLLKVFLIVSCLVAGCVVGAKEKFDYKKLLYKYASAYSAMDEKELARLVSEKTFVEIQKELQTYKKLKEQVRFTILLKKINSNGKDIATVSTLNSLKINNKYLFRNEFANYFFKNGKIIYIANNFKSTKYNYFWKAALHADEIGIITSKNRGNNLKLTGFLSGKAPDIKIKFPNWIVWQTRTPGNYLLPLTKNASGYMIKGNRYSIPRLEAGEAVKYNKLINLYKIIEPNAENTFLKQIVQNEKYTSLDFVCIRRLSSIGEFSRVMPQKDSNFWTSVYFQKNMTIGTKRYLLYEMSRNNFLNSIAIFEAALKNPKLSTMAGRIFAKKNKKRFEKLMISWLSNDKLRQFALMNSQNMIKNTAYVSAAMKYFKPKNKKELIYFIPILCVSSNSKGQKFIKTFLTTAKNQKDFMLYLVLLKNISDSRSTDYTKELKIFLKNHKNNRFVMNGVVYPQILACLCKANDIDGYKQTLEYISTLKTESKQPRDRAKVSTFLRVFYLYNAKLHTLEKIKKDILAKLAKLKNLQSVK
jgi:hypothetical protein